MPRKTDSRNPADWLWISSVDLDVIRLAAAAEIGFPTLEGKLAEVLEKIMKAELIRDGWRLEKTHDLDRLLELLVERNAGFAAQFEPHCDALAEAYFSNRYPGFDLDDPDWPAFREQLQQVAALHATVEARVAGQASGGPA